MNSLGETKKVQEKIKSDFPGRNEDEIEKISAPKYLLQKDPKEEKNGINFEIK